MYPNSMLRVMELKLLQDICRSYLKNLADAGDVGNHGDVDDVDVTFKDFDLESNKSVMFC